MGSNIHAHIEVKKNDGWHHFSAPNITRDYLLFAAIAGGRLADRLEDSVQVHPVAKIKKLPDDMTLVTRISHGQDKSLGLHSECVLTAEDLVELQNELYRLRPLVGRSCDSPVDLESSIFHAYINGNTLAQHQGWDDLRIICWFDN